MHFKQTHNIMPRCLSFIQITMINANVSTPFWTFKDQNFKKIHANFYLAAHASSWSLQPLQEEIVPQKINKKEIQCKGIGTTLTYVTQYFHMRIETYITFANIKHKVFNRRLFYLITILVKVCSTKICNDCKPYWSNLFLLFCYDLFQKA